jgi:hypothetical protein
MCWQHSRTYSWHVADCYAVRDWGVGVPMEGKSRPIRASFGSWNGEIRSIQPEIVQNRSIRTNCSFELSLRARLPRASLDWGVFGGVSVWFATEPITRWQAGCRHQHSFGAKDGRGRLVESLFWMQPGTTWLRPIQAGAQYRRHTRSNALGSRADQLNEAGRCQAEACRPRLA